MMITDTDMLSRYLKTKIDIDGVIADYMVPVWALQELRKQDKQLAALLAAGNALAERLRDNREAAKLEKEAIDKLIVFSTKDAAALAAWEAVTR
jgi:hypothetical protein